MQPSFAHSQAARRRRRSQQPGVPAPPAVAPPAAKAKETREKTSVMRRTKRRRSTAAKQPVAAESLGVMAEEALEALFAKTGLREDDSRAHSPNPGWEVAGSALVHAKGGIEADLTLPPGADVEEAASSLQHGLRAIQSSERAKLLHNQALAALGLEEEQEAFGKHKRRRLVHRLRALFAHAKDATHAGAASAAHHEDADPTVYVPPLHIAHTPPGVKPKRYNRGLEDMLQRNALEAARIQQAGRDANHEANSRIDVAVAAMHLVRACACPAVLSLASPPAPRRALAPLTPGRAVVDPRASSRPLPVAFLCSTTRASTSAPCHWCRPTTCSGSRVPAPRLHWMRPRSRPQVSPAPRCACPHTPALDPSQAPAQALLLTCVRASFQTDDRVIAQAAAAHSAAAARAADEPTETEIRLVKPEVSGADARVGLTLATGPSNQVLVSHVLAGGLAARHGGLRASDRILAVNGVSVIDHDSATGLVRAAVGEVVLAVRRF